MLWRVKVAILSERRPLYGENRRKQALFHDIRACVYLYERTYFSTIVLAGLLYDAVEWYGVSAVTIRKEFGVSIANIVVAYTKENAIKGLKEKIKKIITHCVNAAKDALIVKVADVCKI